MWLSKILKVYCWQATRAYFNFFNSCIVEGKESYPSIWTRRKQSVALSHLGKEYSLVLSGLNHLVYAINDDCNEVGN